MKKPKADILLEASWEVCNKVGGIYTVLSSKANQIRRFYNDDNYFCIGPYFSDKAIGNFEEEPPKKECKQVCNELKQEGIIVHFGKWLIKGEPNVILVDFENYYYMNDQIKKRLWDDYKVDSLRTGHDYDEPVVWSYAAYRALSRLIPVMFPDKKIVLQCHEWLTAPILLFLKKDGVNIATTFHTHATILGRTLASNNVDLYCIEQEDKCHLEVIDTDKEAYKYGIEAKYQLEKTGANITEVFTTVSEITALEAGFILKRKPDHVLPNGLDMEKFPTFEEASIQHRINRASIRRFLLFYFFPYYSFNIKNTLIFFLAGRYEFRDKGIDIYVKALANLNEMLKRDKESKTIVAFIWVPGDIRSIKPELLESKTLFTDIDDSLKSEISDIRKNILYTVLAEKELKAENIFSSDYLFDTKKRVSRFKKYKGRAAPVSTHDLHDPNDTILKHLLESGLDNMADDKVKVVFYPIYLTGADNLLDLTYYESMNGAHLGVFPSFYEPWGYTPLEAAALGVSSVTTDLAGFGKYIMKKRTKVKTPGIFVLKRMNRKDEEIVVDLANFMYRFSKLSKHDRVRNKIEAKRLASMADWKKMVIHYIHAHNLAIEKKFGK